MTKQVLFAITLVATIAVFLFTINRIIRYFRLTKPEPAVGHLWKRIMLTLRVAFGQTRIFRYPVLGFLHALVFWGFCLILFGSIEMIIDGLSGSEKILSFLGPVYPVLIAAGDLFALLVALSVIVFLFRRLFLHIKRFEGREMKSVSHIDAVIALSLILLLMISLLSMNMAYIAQQELARQEILGNYPVSRLFVPWLTSLSPDTISTLYEISWWMHILLIFLFANILPYSKHFHVFMSVPNVFLSRLEPLGKMDNMESITGEVKLMMNPDIVPSSPDATIPEPGRFGVRDVEDITWKTYFDSLSCTECGRCTAVCPANLTGKKLSPRKIMMDVRARMKQKGPGMVKNGKGYDDGKSLLHTFITTEELWACTTCNACARECPVNINHPSLILDMRRYLIMEEAWAPGEIKCILSHIENNGAPWQYSQEDRLKWAENLELTKG